MAILRKIKKRLTKIMQDLPVDRQKRKKTERDTEISDTIKIKEISQRTKKEALGVQEMVIEKTKFSHPEAFRVRRVIPEELPSQYGQDKIVLQVRDPWWIHAYWEITPGIINSLRERLGDTFFSAKIILRVYDVSHIVFDGTNAHRFFDIDLSPEANNWYIDTAAPGRSWCVDIGLRLSTGEFIRIARSNTVCTPLEGPSWIMDEEWMIPEDMFARLYGMGFGFGRSSPVGKGWQEKIKREFFASPGVTSVASPVRKIPRERQFWLVVNTELILYGATEPNAKVCVQGKQINLRADGTFTLRFALPDGKQVIPVKATSSDLKEERTITPIVTRETK